MSVYIDEMTPVQYIQFLTMFLYTCVHCWYKQFLIHAITSMYFRNKKKQIFPTTVFPAETIIMK